ncbi:MAG: hypothetical protein HC927_09695 [Deltaproteobacteria bacterium]|nr:hypothetical protein [Deltaproteobacteria bacterium]
MFFRLPRPAHRARPSERLPHPRAVPGASSAARPPARPRSARCSTPTAATAGSSSTAQVVYSTLGGATALCAKLFSSILDTINALSKGEVKFSSELLMISSLVQLATTFPVGDTGTVLNLSYGSWAIGIMDLLVDFCAYLTPRTAVPEMNTFVVGPYTLLSTTVQLGLAIAALVLLCQEDSGDDLAWDVEGFVEELAYAVAGYGSGIAKIDPDPVTEAIEEGVAIACTFIGIFLGAVRDIVDMNDSEIFYP